MVKRVRRKLGSVELIARRAIWNGTRTTARNPRIEVTDEFTVIIRTVTMRRDSANQ